VAQRVPAHPLAGDTCSLAVLPRLRGDCKAPERLAQGTDKEETADGVYEASLLLLDDVLQKQAPMARVISSWAFPRETCSSLPPAAPAMGSVN
jgi:hypothetical protein